MKTTWTLFALSMVLLTGCHTPLNHPDNIPPSAPTGLYTATGDNVIQIGWNPNPEPDVAGYDVFVSPSYNGPYKLIGTTSAIYYTDAGAANGNTYYYAVTAFDFNGNESDLSKDVAYDVPRPEGYGVMLSDFHVDSVDAGYNFSTYSIVAYNASNADMYFDNFQGTLYMDVYTDTDIQDLGYTNSLRDVIMAPTSGWSATRDAVLYAGHTYIVWTHDDHYAKFRVTSVSSGRVVFDWAYQLQKGNPMLKRQASLIGRSGTIHEQNVH